jgi:hypothetical protein
MVAIVYDSHVLKLFEMTNKMNHGDIRYVLYNKEQNYFLGPFVEGYNNLSAFSPASIENALHGSIDEIEDIWFRSCEDSRIGWSIYEIGFGIRLERESNRHEMKLLKIELLEKLKKLEDIDV